MVQLIIDLLEKLAQKARESDLNVSQITQEALHRELAVRQTNHLLDTIAASRTASVPHEVISAAVDEAKNDLETTQNSI